MNYEIYSIESYKNFFCYTGYDYTHDCYYQYKIGCGYDDMSNLHKHLLSNMIQIGFNNLCLSYPVLHGFIQNFTVYKKCHPDYVASVLKLSFDDIVSVDNYFIKDSEKYIKQVDLFRILHYNNKSLATGLADIKFHLGMSIIEKPRMETVSRGDVYDILLHSTNNTQAITALFKNLIGQSSNPYYKGMNIIQARYNIRNQLGIPCINYSDSRLGEQMVLKLYCDRKGINYADIKEKRTNRYGIRFSECLPPITFNNSEFQSVRDYYESYVMTDFSKTPEKVINICNVPITFGVGGIHGSNRSGRYFSDEEYVYLDLDVTSYYPVIMCKYNIHPEHFDDDFISIYNSEIVSKRLSELQKDNPNLTLIYTLKKASNACFGKMADKDSPLFDYLSFYKAVVYAQMHTALWIDRLLQFDIGAVFFNTDGMILKVKRSDLNSVMRVSSEFANEYGFLIKQKVIRRMFMKDINNYTLQYDDGSYKNKGLFDFYKEFHKDPSSKIIPIALFNYFMKDIPFDETISTWKRIDEFCIRIKVRSNNRYFYNDTELFKTNRYFVSNDKENAIYKLDNNERLPMNRLYNQTLLNRIESHNAKDYNINYKYYSLECRKVVDSIIVKQLELF